MAYLSHSEQDIQTMLQSIGAGSIDELFQDIPGSLRLQKELKLPSPLSEMDITRHIQSLAGKNKSLDILSSFLGAGCYHHFIPAIVKHLAGRSEFYTSYTPYQAEASQGILQAFFEYQTMICQLTRMDVSNASLYDGATGLAEAILMALAITKKKKVILSKTIHPEYRQVVNTYLRDLDAHVVEIDFEDGRTSIEQLKNELASDPPNAFGGVGTACVAIQNPNFFGLIEEMDAMAELTHQAKALLIAVVNPISLGILKPPGEYNADIAVGEGQPLGNEMAYGGPHLGFFATKQEYVRKMPGRLIGETVDTKGQRGFVLTLATREQHIRRAKATSNICTNEALCALKAAIYLSAMGKYGIKRIADLCLQKAHYAAEKITALKGFSLSFKQPFFNEFVVKCSKLPRRINRKLLQYGIIGGFELDRFYSGFKDSMLVCVTEMTTKDQIDKYVSVLKSIMKS